jgi:uncharacterized protein (TIGR02996 family)
MSRPVGHGRTSRRKALTPEAAFVKQLSEDPDDLATPLVYADWLDDSGAADRAAFLRLQHDVLQLRHRQRGFSESSRRLLRMGKKLVAEWLEVVSRPRLEGTCWKGPSSIETFYVWRFLPGGVLNYTSPSGTFQNGTWKQIGTCVQMESNRHYADYEGFVGGDWIYGTARNVTGQRWRWRVQRTTDPDDCDPGVPVTTVFGGHANDPPRRGRRRR